MIYRLYRGIFRDNGTENGNYCIIIGNIGVMYELYKNNGQEHGNCYIIIGNNGKEHGNCYSKGC